MSDRGSAGPGDRVAVSMSGAAPEQGDAWYATDPSALEPSPERDALEQSLVMKARGAAAKLLTEVEAEVQRDPSGAFAFDATGGADLTACGRTFRAGRFSTPTIAELRVMVAERPRAGRGRVMLSVLQGAHALTDIGTLQATAPPGTLFQVASQFNCLEAPSPSITPVREYLNDHTQGPRASVGAFPGTLLRHYAAPASEGARFVQTDARSLNLLADVFDATTAEVRSGYFRAAYVKSWPDLEAAFESRFESLRVGVHDDVEVVFGHDWDGPVPSPRQRIAQVLTSTLAQGSYGRDDGSAAVAAVRRGALRGAYLGTLLAAAALGKHTVVLTLIGGGVFGNPHPDIWAAIHAAVREVEAFVDGTMLVLVNTREPLADADRREVHARGGFVADLGRRA